MATRIENKALLFTETKNGIDGYLDGWFFLVHKTFKPALDIIQGERIDTEKTIALRNKISIQQFGISHEDLKRGITDSGKTLGSSKEHSEIMRYAHRFQIETIGVPPSYSFRDADCLESRCGKWCVQVISASPSNSNSAGLVNFWLYSHTNTSPCWRKYKNDPFETTQIKFVALLKTGMMDSLLILCDVPNTPPTNQPLNNRQSE